MLGNESMISGHKTRKTLVLEAFAIEQARECPGKLGNTHKSIVETKKDPVEPWFIEEVAKSWIIVKSLGKTATF